MLNNKINFIAVFRKNGYIIFIFFIAFFSFLIGSCGLPTYPYLYAPEIAETRTNPENNDYDLIFNNASDNNTNIFSGYEVYYKIYDPLDSATAGAATEYITDRNNITAITGANRNTLISKDFNRLFFTTTIDDTSFLHNESFPSFQITQSLLDEEFKIRLLMQQGLSAGQSFFAAVWGNSSLSFPETQYFYRWVYNEFEHTSKRKFFNNDDFNIYDNDLPDSIDYSSLEESLTGDYYLYITFYIFSYGRDPDDITKSVYSSPVYLGTLKFDCIFEN